MATRRGGLVSAADSTMAKQKLIAICAAKRSKTPGPRGRITLHESLEDAAEGEKNLRSGLRLSLIEVRVQLWLRGRR